METGRSGSSQKGQLPLVLDIFAKGRYNNIDRRKCQRVVPMKVLCLGLSRTGTSSLRQALHDLGYDDVYHQASINIDNRLDSEIWLDAYRAKYKNIGKPFGRKEFDQLLGHCMAVTDVPCTAFWEELMDAYPEAKVVLNVRDNADAWYKSFMATSIKLLDGIYGNGLVALGRSWFIPVSAGDKCTKLLLEHDDAFGNCYKDQQRGTTTGKAAYDRHNNNIIRKAKSQGREVLIYNVKEGWSPLCNFLGHPVPDEPFPYLNDKQEFQKGTSKLLGVVAVFAGLRAFAFAVPVAIGAYLMRRWVVGA